MQAGQAEAEHRGGLPWAALLWGTLAGQWSGCRAESTTAGDLTEVLGRG